MLDFAIGVAVAVGWGVVVTFPHFVFTQDGSGLLSRVGAALFLGGLIGLIGGAIGGLVPAPEWVVWVAWPLAVVTSLVLALAPYAPYGSDAWIALGVGVLGAIAVVELTRIYHVL